MEGRARVFHLANIFRHYDGNLPYHSVLDCLMLEVEVNALFGCWNRVGVGNALVPSLERNDAEVRISI
jgi:hypothetical protein